MKIMHFILDKMQKLLTYYTSFYHFIIRCKVIWPQKQSGFLANPVCSLECFLWLFWFSSAFSCSPKSRDTASISAGFWTRGASPKFNFF